MTVMTLNLVEKQPAAMRRIPDNWQASCRPSLAGYM